MGKQWASSGQAVGKQWASSGQAGGKQGTSRGQAVVRLVPVPWELVSTSRRGSRVLTTDPTSPAAWRTTNDVRKAAAMPTHTPVAVIDDATTAWAAWAPALVVKSHRAAGPSPNTSRTRQVASPPAAR